MIHLLHIALMAVGPPAAPSQDHPALHPPGCVLYAEIPDVPAVYRAYATTALARVLGDEELQAALGEVLGRDPVDPVELLLEQYRLSVGEGQAPPILEDLLRPLRAASLSLSLEGVGLGELIQAAERLQAEGTDPQAYLLEHVGLQLNLEFEGNAAAEQAEELLGDLLAEAAAGAAAAGAEPGLVREGSHCCLVLGSSTTQGFLRRLQSEEPGWGGDALAAGSEHFRAQGTPVLELFNSASEMLLDIPEVARGAVLLDLVEGLLGPNVTMLVRGGRWRVVIDDDGRFVTEGFHRRHVGGLNGVLASQPVGQNALRLIHPDAIVAWAVHLDKQPLLELVREELGKLGEDPFEELERAYGFRPDRDLLAPLGPAVAYSLPAPKSLLAAPPLTFSAALTDREAFVRGMDGLVELLRREGRDELRVTTAEYRGARLYTLELDLGDWGELPLPISPSSLVKPTLAVMDDLLILTTLPTHAKREVRRALRQEPELHPILAAADLPQGCCEVGFSDWMRFLGKVYSGAKAMAQMFAGMGGEELPFDIEALPSSELITRHFAPTVRWRRNVEGGVLHHQESSWGPEVPLMLGIGVWTAALAAAPAAPAAPAAEPRGVFESATAPDVSADARGLAPPEVTVEWSSTLATLMEMRVALALYRQEKGAYPGDLEALSAATEDHPRGYLGGPLVPDAWGNPFLYALEEGEARLWSRGPDGKDQGGGGDDIVAR